MKRIAITTALLVLIIGNTFCQEIMIDGIKSNKFQGIVSGGEMEQYMYIASFISPLEGKKNFSITHLSPFGLDEMQKIQLELPNSYTLRTSSFSMDDHFLIFHDNDKKEDVFIIVKGSNVNKKKTSKHSNHTYIAITSSNSEGFIYATVDKKGNYKVTMVDLALEKIWERSFSTPSGTTWDIISIKEEMGGIAILRKESKSGNKYAFTKHIIDAIEGNDILVKTITGENLSPYPTFISSKEGMSFTGGYYYKDGVYTGKPDGVFFAMLSPDFTLEQMTKVPFSQVIEDIKSTSSNKLLSDNVSIGFVDGYMSHETQSFVMIGQLFTRKKTEQGIDVSMGEIITVEFNMERGYLHSTASKIEEQRIQLKGDFEGINNLDLGTWMKNAGLFPYQFSLPTPGYPMISYQTRSKNEPTSLCFKNIGIKQDTAKKLCENVTKFEDKTTTYNFKGIKAPIYPSFTNGIITNPMDMMNVISYELNNNNLHVFKMQVPNLDGISIDIEQMEENIDEEVEANNTEE